MNDEQKHEPNENDDTAQRVWLKVRQTLMDANIPAAEVGVFCAIYIKKATDQKPNLPESQFARYFCFMVLDDALRQL